MADSGEAYRREEEAVLLQGRLLQAGRIALESGERLSELRDSFVSLLSDRNARAAAFRSLNGAQVYTPEQADALLVPVLELLKVFEIPAPVALKQEALPPFDMASFPDWLANQIEGVAAATEHRSSWRRELGLG